MTPTSRDTSIPGPAISAIERAAWLDGVATPISRGLRAVLSPGAAKDALSGTQLGHPLHPVLTDVVVGSLLSVSALDLLAGPEADPYRARLIGVAAVTYAPTAASGASDWLDATADPRVKRTGIVHAAANLVGISCYVASIPLARRRGRGAAIALRVAGLSAMGLGALLGGHLSFRRNVGPDQTVFDAGPSEWTPAVDGSQLVPGRPHRAVVGDTPVLLLLRDDGRVVALHDRCSHRGCSLAEGEVEGDEIVCPCHLSRFSLDDGSVRRGPAVAPAPVYETRRNGSIVHIRLAERDAA